MTDLSNYEFLPEIPATRENAIQTNVLTLEDVTAGGFKNPKRLADPNNLQKVDTQLDKFKNHPERYSAYRQENGLIIAYVKANEWFTRDEAPFIENFFARQALLLASKIKNEPLEPKAFGVLGLVASKDLPERHRSVLLEDLLLRSIGRAAAESATVLNIVLHTNDPVIPIVKDLGFEPRGHLANADGAPGKKQQRYQLAISQN